MPIHKSFHQEELLLGVQKGVFLILFLVFVLISYLFVLPLGIVITVVAYIPCRILTKIDPHMITIALNSRSEEHTSELQSR